MTIMPFKLRLKRSRQYNVVSKSLFVIGVELLDSNSVECTLATESLGRECLDNICQKLSFQQPEFFGLRYVSNTGAPRWVELDRPLKKQLDKHGQKYTVYLRIMYYVSGISLLTDETTRYHYFLQLKSDVIEGRIKCNMEQAILLASYSMQAEFGNHDSEKHTPEYLKEFVLFPKRVISGHQLELTEAVIHQHAALAGLPQGTAEEYYILAAQQLEGYGQETFIAKDGNGNEVFIGIKLTGIIVKIEATQFSTFYKWTDITNVVNHKKYFGIECQIPEETVHYQFQEPDAAKYVWRMCVHQHTFFIQYGQLSEQGNTAEIVKLLFSRQPVDELHVSNNDEEVEADYKIDERVLNHNSIINQEVPSTIWERQKAQSTSCLDLSTVNPEVDGLRALLPGYRLAPDYETAVQQKYYGQYSSDAKNVNLNSILYSSHPDIHSAVFLQQQNNTKRSMYEPYPDVAQVDRLYEMKSVPAPHAEQAVHTCSHPELDTVTKHLIQGVRMMHLYKPPPPYPINKPSSNSTPDLACQTFAQHSHYFISSQVSGSSPDLVSSRSPYHLPCLEYRLKQHPNDMLPNPEAHRTYTNLSVVIDPQQRIDNLKSKLDPINLYLKRQNGGALIPPHGYMFPSNQYGGVINISEPIYENIPLPWPTSATTIENSVTGGGIGSRSRASSIQSASEINGTATADKNVVPLSQAGVVIIEGTGDTSKEKTSVDIVPSTNRKESITTFSSSTPSTISSSSRLNYGNQLRGSSIVEVDSNHSGTLGKERNNKGRKKWGGILSGGKYKHVNRHEDESMDSLRTLHDSLPKQPLPITIPKEQICQLLEKKLEDSQLIFEFEKIPRIKTNADFTTALMPENIKRNWHKDILPYEENRVRLSPTKENKLGYINASNVTASVGNEQKFYIAAQSPMTTTINNFWQMIWESDVYLVVSLVDSNDANNVSYFHGAVTDKPFETGEFQIWSQFSQETGHCVTTKFRVFHSPSRRVRGVWHLQYSEWINDGCPKDVAHFLGFIEELSSVRQHYITEIPAGHNRNPPILVHCCTGIGRSAVVILSDLLLYILDHNQELDVARIVLLMRHQRMLMIETVTQYRFVYSLLAFYLKNSRLI